MKNRYAGTCTQCGEEVAEGAGKCTKSASGRWKVTHNKCTRGTVAARAYSTRKARKPALRAAGPSEREVNRSSQPYEIGEVRHCPRISGGGGKDGRWWTVVAKSSHRITEGENDCREGEQQYDAIVRPATDVEIAPILARRGLSAAREGLVAPGKAWELLSYAEHPAQEVLDTAEMIIQISSNSRQTTAHFGTEAIYVVGKVAYYQHPGHYDDYIVTYHRGPAQEVLDRLAALEALDSEYPVGREVTWASVGGRKTYHLEIVRRVGSVVATNGLPAR